MFPWFTIAKYGIPLLIAGIIGFGSAWKLQGLRLDSAKQRLSVVEQAKAVQDETIAALKDEVAKQDKTCRERLASKDRAINGLRGIDEIKPKVDNQGKPVSDDPLLRALNGMFHGK